MKIAYIAAGAGGMYCGNCLHDNTLAAALIRAGHEVLLIPTYTPLRTDDVDVSMRRVFFGGINVYLQQKWPIFRRTPWLLDRLLDYPWLLNFVSKRAISTKASDLGDLAISMLLGDEGHQAKELDKLVGWLAEERPDVVHLSNVLLSGMARQIRERLQVPVVCTLSGEDLFLKDLQEPYTSRARDILRERVADLHSMVAMNQYYADLMSSYLQAEPERVRVIYEGLNLNGHALRKRLNPEPLVIGYLARICPPKGLHLLIDAFERLADDPDMPPVHLRVAGYLGPGDLKYFRNLEAQLAKRGLGERFEYVGEVTRADKIEFLHSLDVLSMPTVHPETKGLPVLEALANGVPVVVPGHGTFPELVERTGGGLLCEPNDPASLAANLKRLLRDQALATQASEAGRAAICELFHDNLMAQQTEALYRELMAASPRPPEESQQMATAACCANHSGATDSAGPSEAGD